MSQSKLPPPHLSQIESLRRKLAACGCHPPLLATSLDDLIPAFSELRHLHGLPPSTNIDTTVLTCLHALAGAQFDEVHNDELNLLRPTTTLEDPSQVPPGRADLLQRAHGAALCGLALSGGGVRSATFGLGALQALARLKLLHRVDYLSTVSGGGFVGGWLIKCLHAHQGNMAAMEAILAPPAGSSEAPELRFLRQYSNYLAPRGGMFSADTWTLLGTYVRNTALNLTMLVTWLCALLMLPRFTVWAVDRIVEPGGPWAHWGDIAWITGVVLFLMAVFAIALSISSQPSQESGLRRFPLSQSAVLWCIVLPLTLAGFLGSLGLWRYGGLVPIPELLDEVRQRWGWLLAPGFVYFIIWACGWYLAHERTSVYHRSGYAVCGMGLATVVMILLEAAQVFAPAILSVLPASSSTLWHTYFVVLFVLVCSATYHATRTPLHMGRPLRLLSCAELCEGLAHLLCALLAFALGTILLLVGLSLLPNPNTHPVLNNAIALTTFGMPLMMMLFTVTMNVMIGLLGALYSDASREWWSRQGAWTAIFALCWLAIHTIAFFLSPLLYWAWETMAPWSNIGTLLGWLLMTALGIKAGTDMRLPSSRFGAWNLEQIARLAPYLFTLGVLALLGMLVQAVVALPRSHCPPSVLACIYAAHARATLDTDFTTLTLAFATFLMAALVLGWRVDINKFSLNMLYRNRVVRAWLGASNRTRQPHPFTGFDPDDDILLTNLAGQRPYPIINASLNLTSSRELAWRHRRSCSFTFTPLWSGYEQPDQEGSASGCYRPTKRYAARPDVGLDDDAGVKLGMAAAVSGAAVSPNMGVYSSAPLNFLMTMFNVRLGRWCPNPRKSSWTSTAPPIGLFSLVSELFGYMDADASYVHLSDGGHFDNLGIYELVRRRCRLVIAIDVGSDRQLAFEDLGNAIRRCATDLNVRIDLNVSRMMRDHQSGIYSASCSVGTIRYSMADVDAPDGTLLYLKPAIVGSENADLLNYRKLHPDYPHESIADQWFDEAQFESYRALGEYVTSSALGDLALDKTGNDIVTLCEKLQARHRKVSSGEAAQEG